MKRLKQFFEDVHSIATSLQNVSVWAVNRACDDAKEREAKKTKPAAARMPRKFLGKATVTERALFKAAKRPVRIADLRRAAHLAGIDISPYKYSDSGHFRIPTAEAQILLSILKNTKDNGKF